MQTANCDLVDLSTDNSQVVEVGVERTSLRIANYKSFGPSGGTIPCIKRFNLIVGRNNSGKSALIDAVEFASSTTKIDVVSSTWKDAANLTMRYRLDYSIINAALSAYGHRYDLMSLFGNSLKDEYVEFCIASSDSLNSTMSPPENPGIRSIIESHNLFDPYQSIRRYIPNCFDGKKFWKISAERDIEAEVFGTVVKPNGLGVTGLMATFLHMDGYQRHIVQKDMLNCINSILYPDTEFREIVIRNRNEKWEIFLVNNEDQPIRLSDSGSGLKTIIMMVCYIELIPVLEGKPLSEYIFAFEEPENNLHPAVQRRLIEYVLNRSRSSGFTVFVTTHSAAIIDAVSNQDEVQILHVANNGVNAEVRTVEARRDSHSVIDDLGLRASDLLQANCLVWLEGPSDRIYFNKWIELVSQGNLKEGLHYQCIFYGGKVLSHFSYSDEFDDTSELLDAITVNRNAIVLIDSDLKAPEGKVNDTKLRVQNEINERGGVCWISDCREVENYIPDVSLCRFLKKDNLKLDRFSDIKQFLNEISDSSGDRFERTKVLFAREVVDFIMLSEIEDRYNWKEKILECSEFIKRCNGIV